MTLAIRFIPNAGRAVIYSVNRAGLPGDGYDGRYSVSGRHFDPRPSNQAYGATADRPANVPGRISWPPSEMYDTTLGAPIFLVPGSNPARWVNITGSPV